MKEEQTWGGRLTRVRRGGMDGRGVVRGLTLSFDSVSLDSFFRLFVS